MDSSGLVRSARSGDVKAFVELTRRFQHFAFGLAVALTGDFQRAEDVVQEAFLAAWLALPSLSDPAAFPGWLRGVVRHHAFRLLRQRHLETVSLSAANNVPAELPVADRQLEERERAAATLAAIGALPIELREPATLFYVHECSQQDVAVFLGLSVTTVNNRLHAARTQLKRRMLTMVKATLEAHDLPDEFANRIGRLVADRGGVVDALFGPAALPDLLAELAISDEANHRAVTVQVIQRPGDGIVRAVPLDPVDRLPRGSTVLKPGHATQAAINSEAFQKAVPLLAPQAQASETCGTLLETGIKVIDVLCPLAVGGTVAIAGEFAAGGMVVMEELVRRLSGGAGLVSLFAFLQWPATRSPDWSLASELKKEGYSEGTVGAVQTFFFRAEDAPWTAERLATLAPVDVVIHLSRDQARRKIYPCLDPLSSRSRWLQTPTVSREHSAIAGRVRDAMALLRSAGDSPASDGEALTLQRARKLGAFFGQPFFVAEPYTRRPGSYVPRDESLTACREILDGEHDDLPLDTFAFTGSLSEIRARAHAGQSPEPPPWQQAS